MKKSNNKLVSLSCRDPQPRCTSLVLRTQVHVSNVPADPRLKSNSLHSRGVDTNFTVGSAAVDLPQKLLIAKNTKTALKPISEILPQKLRPRASASARSSITSSPRKANSTSNNSKRSLPTFLNHTLSSDAKLKSKPKTKKVSIKTASKQPPTSSRNQKFNANPKMGWGQPLNATPGGKRGRHSSDENRNTASTNGSSSSSGGNSDGSSTGCGSSTSGCLGSFKSENLTETEQDMKASHQFGKRPRDVSPPLHETMGDCVPAGCDLDVLPDANRLTIRDHGDAPSCSKNHEYQNSKKEEYSKKASVISKSKNIDQEPHQSSSSMVYTDEKFYDLGDLKIRTSTPKLLRKGPQKAHRGPRVSAARTRTALPSRRMSSPKKSRRPADSSSGSGSTSTSTSASTFSEEESNYVDIDCEEVDDSEESTFDGGDDDEEISASSTPSVDIIPPEACCPEIVPAIRPSYFPNVPPYINFCLHNQRTEPLPREIQKHLKWRMSNITPVVVKKTLANSGYRLLRKTVEWNGHWGRHMKAALFKSSIKDFQKLNHLPGTFQIGRKDRLWRNIQRFMNKFGKEEFGFMPKTFVLPIETKQLKQAWDSADSKNQLWIVKPPALARGTGIRVVNRWSQVPKKKPMIVQSYIGNPYLINDRKFDLRIYVLVTNFHPLKVYIYNDGLVRFAPVKYSSDTKRAGDRYMHLTNYSINKNCELYTKNEDADASVGHKWTLKTLWRHFLKEGKNVEKLWSEIEEIVIKTLICAEDPIVSSTTCYLPNLYNGYELFGYDIILDADLKPWLLEVNISPSLHSSSPLDLAVKGPMIKELLNIVGYHLPPKLSPVVKAMLSSSLDVALELETPVFDKRIYVNNSLSKEEQAKHKFFKTRFEKRAEYLDELIENLTPDDIRQLITAEDELSQCYNFYRIYPTTSTHTYTPYFEFPRYYNMLFDAWENKYHDDRPAAVTRLRQLCRQKIHLQVPVNAGSMISESPVTNELNGDLESQQSIDTEEPPATPSTSIGEQELTEELTKTSSTLSEICQTEDKILISSHPVPTLVPTAAAKVSPTPSAVLDNITNSCSRSIGSNCPCHPHTPSSSSSSNGGKTQINSSIPPTPKVADLPKGICF